jgi:DNA-binding transcriptional LysR family regulator
MGIAIGRAPLISPDLASGRLVMADTKVIDIETGYWLVGPDGQETRPAIRSFRRWVLEESKEYCEQNGLR